MPFLSCLPVSKVHLDTFPISSFEPPISLHSQAPYSCDQPPDRCRYANNPKRRSPPQALWARHSHRRQPHAFRLTHFAPPRWYPRWLHTHLPHRVFPRISLVACTPSLSAQRSCRGSAKNGGTDPRKFTRHQDLTPRLHYCRC